MGSRVYTPALWSEIFVVHSDPRILDPLNPLMGAALKVSQHTQPPWETFLVELEGQI